jgi:hypothetical protein
LGKPTGPMEKEAVSAGFYKSPLGKNYPKIQILGIEELLSGAKKPEYPDLSAGAATFKKARIEEKQSEQKSLL